LFESSAIAYYGKYHITKHALMTVMG
jgi:hypothetical protein